ncbi:MAG: acyl carrier protein [Alphaproteobacteria bacterium]|nr:acyl carrier protein [Alphaproteobacteria bacterium]
MSNQTKLMHCFREAFALPADASVDGMTYQKDPVWDSVAHMRLVAGIETAFGIMFTTDQILDMSSFVKAREIVGQHGVTLEA